MKDFKEYISEFGEYGEVTMINIPIVEIVGLPSVRNNEIVMFENGEQGKVIFVDEAKVNVLLMSHIGVSVGDQVARTGKMPSIKLSKDLLGKTVNAMGIDVGQKDLVGNATESLIDVTPASMSMRFTAHTQFLSGVSVVDLLIPLGHGQRELVVGDRKTGKTSFLLSILKNHIVTNGGVGVYNAIGLSDGEIKSISTFIEDNNLAKSMVFVASSASDPHGMVIMSPFTAMTIAEYFRDEGQDVFLVLDNLSNHAKYYREVSLLQRSFPGRDSYPGDIFYLHARLLERAGSFEVVPGQLGSITCMPVAQTTQNDLTDYIVSNLIGITDGHILFDLEQFSRGRRPAISIGLSVTRLGRQTQSPLLREMNRKLSAFLSSNYEKSMQLSHFGSELSEKVQNDLEIGSNLYSSFNQDVIDSVPLPVMIIFATMSWLNFFHTDNSINIVVYRKHLVESFNQKQETKEFLEKLIDVNNFQELQIAVDKNKLKLLELCKKQVR